MEQSSETTHQGSSEENKCSDVVEQSERPEFKDGQSTDSNVNELEDPCTASDGGSGEAGVVGDAGVGSEAGVVGDAGVGGDTGVGREAGVVGDTGVGGESGEGGGLSEEEIAWWSAVKENPSDFTSWTYLLQRIERKGKVGLVREVFDSFLNVYPYCYGYWKKYADFEKKKSTNEMAAHVFERGIEAIPLSIDLWVHYINFTVSLHKEEESKYSVQQIRNLYQRAIEACGLDYRSTKLWDSYLEWETSSGSPRLLLAVFDQVLGIPTQSHVQYFDRFKTFVESVPVSELMTDEEMAELSSGSGGENEMDTGCTITEKLIAKRSAIFEAASVELKKREVYEGAIKRPYFHVKPLERGQLRNWKEYLDFEISQGDEKRIITLFERCMIACSLYEEFWTKFAKYSEASCPAYAGSVYQRACTIHLKQKPNIHVSWSAFEERRGNIQLARDILKNIDSLVPSLVFIRVRRISLEIRHKYYESAEELYRESVKSAQSNETRNFFSWRYARFSTKVLNDHDKSSDILREAISKDKLNTTLYLQLLDLELSRYPLKEENIEKVFELVNDSDLENDVKHSFALRRQQYLEEFGSDISKLLNCQQRCQELKKLISTVKRRASSLTDADSEQVKKPRLDSTTPDQLLIQKGSALTSTASTPITSPVIQLQPGQAPPSDPTQWAAYQQHWGAYNMGQQGYNYQQYYPQYTGYGQTQ